MRSPVRIAVLGVLAALFASNCYRAAANPFQHYDPNHHFLARLLERITTGNR